MRHGGVWNHSKLLASQSSVHCFCILKWFPHILSVSHFVLSFILCKFIITSSVEISISSELRTLTIRNICLAVRICFIAFLLSFRTVCPVYPYFRYLVPPHHEVRSQTEAVSVMHGRNHESCECGEGETCWI